MKCMLIIVFALFMLCYSSINNQTATEWKDDILNDQNLSKKEMKNYFIDHNFCVLWLYENSNSILGFIGDNYQRLYIKIISAKKDSLHSDTYNIYGKSKVKNNICEFKGSIVITSIRCYKEMHYGLDDEYKDKGIKKQGVILSCYKFYEDSSKSYSGIFEGILVSYWYLDKNNKVHYDDIENYSDSYCNNQFVGTWKGYKSQNTKKCNWGDHRIPLSGDLDIGAGEFSVNEEYREYGWQNYNSAVWEGNEKARNEEEKEWWK